MNANKQENIDESWRLLKAAGLNWESLNNGYHWKVAGLDFYPSTHKWMDLKNDFRGEGITEFIAYIRARKHKELAGNILTVEQVFDLAKSSKDKSLFGICQTIHRGIYP